MCRCRAGRSDGNRDVVNKDARQFSEGKCLASCCYLNLAGCQDLFHFGNRLGDFDLARAGVGAVENGAAAPDAEGVANHIQTFFGALIAAVKDEAVGLDDGRRADIFVVGPEAGAGGGAGGAQDAFGRIVETRPVFMRLATFTAVCRRRRVIDEVGQDRAIMLHEWLHVHNQIFDHFQSQESARPGS